MIKELIKLANHLDSKGLVTEADKLDSVINKLAEESDFGEPGEADMLEAEEFEEGLMLEEGSLLGDLSKIVDDGVITDKEMSDSLDELLKNVPEEYRSDIKEGFNQLMQHKLNLALSSMHNAENIFRPKETAVYQN